MRTQQESAKAKWEQAIAAEVSRGVPRQRAVAIVAKARPALRRLLVAEANQKKESR